MPTSLAARRPHSSWSRAARAGRLPLATGLCLAAVLLAAPPSGLLAQAPAAQSAPPAAAFNPVRALDGKGKPLPGAEVHYVFEAEVPRAALGRLGLLDSDSLTQMAFLGQRLAADAEGLAPVPAWPEGVCVVLVRQGVLCDMRNLRQPDAAGTEVRVRDRGTLRLSLTDAEDRALPGSAVCVSEIVGSERRRVRAAPVDGPGGSGQLDLLDELNFRLEEGSSLELEPFGHFARPQRIPLDLENLPTEVVALASTPFGSLEISLTRADGRVPCGRVEVLVRTLGEGASAPVVYLTDDGRLSVPRVGVGTELELVARRPGGSDRAPLAVRGPRAAGESVAAALPFEESELILLGRLADPSGRPLYRRTFHGVAKARSVFFRREFEFYVQTEPDGSFQMLLPLDEKVPYAEASILLEQLDPENRPIARYQWVAAQELRAECLDLGTVQVTPL
jgi:hypothetical protein